MAEHNNYGAAAEQAAAELIRQRGWTILHRNWRFGRRELDLVARRNNMVAFVEVRARRSAGYGHPLATIGFRKRHDLEKAARGWIERHGRTGDVYRFDVVTVTGHWEAGRNAPAVEYVADAWRIG